MTSSICFARARTHSESSSSRVSSTAAERLPSMSSIAPRHDEDPDETQSVAEPAIRVLSSTSSAGSVFSHPDLGNDRPPSAPAAGDIPWRTRPPSFSGSEKRNYAGAFPQHDTGRPSTKVVSSISGGVAQGAPETYCPRRKKDHPVRRQQRSVHNAPPGGGDLTDSLHAHPHSIFTDFPWIPPPPIDGTPPLGCSSMGRDYPHYYDPASASLRSPRLQRAYVRLQSEGHHKDVIGAGWPTPGDLPLPSMFPMPPRVLPQPSASMMSASQAATRAVGTPQHGWPMKSPFFYPFPPPPPPPPWWFNQSLLPSGSISPLGSSSGCSRGSNSRSYSPCSSSRSDTQHRLSSGERREALHMDEEATPSPQRRGTLSRGSVAVPFDVKPRVGTRRCDTKDRLSGASSDSGYSAHRATKVVEAARRPVGLSATPSLTLVTNSKDTKRTSKRAQGVQHWVYASRDREGKGLRRSAREGSAQRVTDRFKVMRGTHVSQTKGYDEGCLHKTGDDSGQTRLRSVLRAAEAHLEKVEHLYQRMRTRYERVMTSPGQKKMCGSGVSRDESVKQLHQPPMLTTETSRAEKQLQKGALLRTQRRMLSAEQRLQPAAPMRHAEGLVPYTLSNKFPLPITPSTASSSSSSLSSSTMSASSLKHELQLLESQWKRLEELKKCGCSGTATVVSRPVAAPSSAAGEVKREGDFTFDSFLQLIQNRKRLLTSAM